MAKGKAREFRPGLYCFRGLVECFCGNPFGLCFALARPLSDVGDGSDSCVDVRCGVEGSDREAHAAMSGFDAELPMDEWCTVKTGAGRDVVIDIEHDADVTGIDAFEVHEDGGEVIFHAVAAVKTNAIDLAQAVDQPLRKSHFLTVNVLDTVFIQPILSGPK
jgi:hypothetical protein